MKEKEIERLKKLKEYENKLYDSGVNFIAGIDEAGRGPLARTCCYRNCNYEARLIYRRCKRLKENIRK